MWSRVVDLHVKRRAVGGVSGDVLLRLLREDVVSPLWRPTRTAVVGRDRDAVGRAAIRLPHPAIKMVLGGPMVQIPVERAETMVVRQAVRRIDRRDRITTREVANAVGAKAPFAEDGR